MKRDTVTVKLVYHRKVGKGDEYLGKQTNVQVGVPSATILERDTPTARFKKARYIEEPDSGYDHEKGESWVMVDAKPGQSVRLDYAALSGDGKKMLEFTKTFPVPDE